TEGEIFVAIKDAGAFGPEAYWTYVEDPNAPRTQRAAKRSPRRPRGSKNSGETLLLPPQRLLQETQIAAQVKRLPFRVHEQETGRARDSEEPRDRGVEGLALVVLEPGHAMGADSAGEGLGVGVEVDAQDLQAVLGEAGADLVEAPDGLRRASGRRAPEVQDGVGTLEVRLALLHRRLAGERELGLEGGHLAGAADGQEGKVPLHP